MSATGGLTEISATDMSQRLLMEREKPKAWTKSTLGPRNSICKYEEDCMKHMHLRKQINDFIMQIMRIST